MASAVADGPGTFAVAFPGISAALDPLMKVRPADGVGVEVKIGQHFDCGRDSLGKPHLVAVDQPVASASDDPGGDADGTSGHRTVFAGTDADKRNDGGTARASNTDC